MEGDPDVVQQILSAATISIHALRVEGDSMAVKVTGANVLISIHALRMEGDTRFLNRSGEMTLFLSTPSGWRATKQDSYEDLASRISIHALRVEGDESRRKLQCCS